MRLIENCNDGYDSTKMLGFEDLYIRSENWKNKILSLKIIKV